MSDGRLDRLGLGTLAGFAIGVAVASRPDEQRPLREFGQQVLAECLRLLEDPRLGAAWSAVSAATPLGTLLPQPNPPSVIPIAPTELPRPRRRRRTRAEIEADNAAAAAAAPVAVAEPEPRRRGRRPAPPPAPVAETVTADVGTLPSQVAIAPTQPTPQPPRRGRRPRQQAATDGNGAVAPARPAAAAPARASDAGLPSAADARLNLNTATRGELLRLPRIGAQAADRIIQFREEHGRITGSRQLRQADVLSPTAWKQIRDLVRF